MPNFEVKIEGLEELRSSLAPKRVKKIVKESIGIGALQLQTALRLGVQRNYTIGASADSVLAKKTSSRAVAGGNLIKADLVYKFKPVSLAKFQLEERTVSVSPPNRYLVKTERGIIVRKRDTTRAVAVRVKRSGGFKVVRGKLGYGGYLVKPTRDLIGINPRRAIYERLQDKTWTTTLFERAPIRPLFGPSISQMVATVFETEPEIDFVLQKLVDRISEAIEL